LLENKNYDLKQESQRIKRPCISIINKQKRRKTMSECINKCLTSNGSLARIFGMALLGALIAASYSCGFPIASGAGNVANDYGEATFAAVAACIFAHLSAGDIAILGIMLIGAVIGAIVGYVWAYQDCRDKCSGSGSGVGQTTQPLSPPPSDCASAQQMLQEAQKRLDDQQRALQEQQQIVDSWDSKISIARGVQNAALAVMAVSWFWNPMAFAAAVSTYAAAKVAEATLLTKSSADRTKLALLQREVAETEKEVERDRAYVNTLCPTPPPIHPPRGKASP
jgi:uncharacterized membrane protein